MDDTATRSPRDEQRALRRAADAELVRRARSGDAAAWEQIVDRHQSLLWWLARQFRLNTEDAADVVQLTWLKCLEHLDQLTDVEALGGWLSTICRRECLRLTGRRGQEVLVSELEEDQHQVGVTGPSWLGDDPGDVVARRDERAGLLEAIERLPPRPRAVLKALMTDDGIGYAQVAERLGVPIGSLGPTRNRALARLRADPRLVLADG
jgi:RNA polymerase sigma factor (sigma-70 family)